jgi:hypothetical protein
MRLLPTETLHESRRLCYSGCRSPKTIKRFEATAGGGIIRSVRTRAELDAELERTIHAAATPRIAVAQLIKLSHMFGRLVLGAVALSACTSSNPATDGGTDAAPPPFSFKPQGCDYTVAPPEGRGFTDLAQDDDKALADFAGATPARVRIGLGGATVKGQPGYADPATTAVFTWESASANHAAKVRIGSDVHRGYAWITPPPERGLGTTVPPANMHEVHVCASSQARRTPTKSAVERRAPSRGAPCNRSPPCPRKA